MVKVCSHGLMEESTKETTMMTRNKERACSHGLMVEDTMVIGSMESNTDSESIIPPKVK